MNEILTFISAEIGLVIIFAVVGLIFKWLFIRSAVKSGVEAALKNSFPAIEENQNKLLQQEFDNEMKNWN